MILEAVSFTNSSFGSKCLNIMVLNIRAGRLFEAVSRQIRGGERLDPAVIQFPFFGRLARNPECIESFMLILTVRTTQVKSLSRLVHQLNYP